jgi:two-component system response regulator
MIRVMPTSGRGASTILIADDDEDDRLMTRDALRDARLQLDVRFVQDGLDLMDYLLRRGRHEERSTSPRPDLILLDLNMPRMDGREALAKIKGDDDLLSIPVVVLTTSKADADVAQCYRLGVNSFITKPVTYLGLVETMKVVMRYWLEISDLPTQPA